MHKQAEASLLLQLRLESGMSNTQSAMRISAIDHTRRLLYYELRQRIEKHTENSSLDRITQEALACELVELFMQGNSALLQELDVYRNAAAEMKLAEVMLRPIPHILIPAHPKRERVPLYPPPNYDAEYFAAMEIMDSEAT